MLDHAPAVLGPTRVLPLPELVAAAARRCGAWVLVERLGEVVVHSAGPGDCPAALVPALLHKQTSSLRAAVAWTGPRGSLRGELADGTVVQALDLGGGGTAWFVGGTPDAGVGALLGAALQSDALPLQDPVVAGLLRPRGPVREGSAPAATLLLLRHAGPVAALARAAVVATAGSPARVHVEDDVVVVALPNATDPGPLCAEVRQSCSTAVAGTAVVEPGSTDWSSAAELARSALRAAQQTGRDLGDPSDPVIAAELVVAQAVRAVARLAPVVRDVPWRRLQEHDARTGGELVRTLTAWCAAGFDSVEAAARLHVHVNTLRYRLRRVREISGLDTGSPRVRLAVQMLAAAEDVA